MSGRSSARRYNPDLERFVARQLREGTAEELGIRNDEHPDVWKLLNQHQREELAIQEDLLQTYGREQCIAVATNTHRHETGAFVVSVDPNLPLPLGSARQESESASAATFRERMKKQRELDVHVARELNSPTCQSVEQLIEVAGDANALCASVKRIHRFARRPNVSHTVEGIEEYATERLLRDSLESTETSSEEVSYLGVSTKKTGGMQVWFQMSSGAHRAAGLRCDLRTLKLLQAAQFFDLPIVVLLGKELDVRKERFVTTLRGLANEQDVLGGIGPLAALIGS